MSYSVYQVSLDIFLVGAPICVGLYQLEFHYAWAHPKFDIDKWDEFHLSWLTLSVQEYTALTNNSWQKINEIRVLQTITKHKDHCVRLCYVRSYNVFVTQYEKYWAMDNEYVLNKILRLQLQISLRKAHMITK